MDLLRANDRDGAYPPSYYASTVPARPALPAAQGPIHTDICIVGGGYTGLSAALHLAQRGYDVVVLDAQRVGFGASGRNGGQVASGPRLDLSTLEARYGRETAHAQWALAREARKLVDELVARGLDCDLRAGVIYATDRAGDVAGYHAEAAHVQAAVGYDGVTPLDRDRIAALVGSAVYAGGVLDAGAAHLNPLKLVLGLADLAQVAGAQIFEGSQVRSVADAGPHVVVTTDAATIAAEQVILAGNGYIGGLDSATAAHVMPINSYMVATEPLGPDADAILPEGHAVADNKFVVNYFRRAPDGRLLFGGGESYRYRFTPDIAAKVRGPLERIFPQLRGIGIDYAWGGTLAITRSRLPFARKVSPRVFSAGGYSGHGVALSLLFGKAMAEAAAGAPERFNQLAALPHAPFPGGAALRAPLLLGAMSLAGLRDRLPF
ncbi:FAD-binding oxidoreductase [Dinoroseobacter sp. PD6]|uniref:NAD(P)/FAD-dependent oxidoreductase n=1 Tax=Dinoroseobacter sp. PD6 TaxID=3028384 RepID=UPI00237B0048|nr:FAD-binding oxidoreductase [Dinoroseobacter sp. PD6]MDD9716521.1 FAD-binding oxidoreductase [Dinoroseobacter sp. PD6]